MDQLIKTYIGEVREIACKPELRWASGMRKCGNEEMRRSQRREEEIERMRCEVEGRRIELKRREVKSYMVKGEE